MRRSYLQNSGQAQCRLHHALSCMPSPRAAHLIVIASLHDKFVMLHAPILPEYVAASGHLFQFLPAAGQLRALYPGGPFLLAAAATALAIAGSDSSAPHDRQFAIRSAPMQQLVTGAGRARSGYLSLSMAQAMDS